MLRLWCGRRLRFGVWCAFVGLVSLAVVGVCVVCMLGRVCGVLVVHLGACPRLSGRGLAALFGVGAVCRGPPPVSAVWFPAPPGWGLLVVCPPAVPFACPPPSVSFPCRLGRCFSGAVPGPSPLWWVGGGPCCRLGSLPLVFPRGEADACTPRRGATLLYGPSICTRSVQMDLLHSQVLQPFPTPGSGTLWVAGESLRDRHVSCLPRWTVCPTRSPSLGPNRSTCRGECSWSGPLVSLPGRCHRRPLTNGPGRIPPYCVCSGGADTVTGEAPKPQNRFPRKQDTQYALVYCAVTVHEASRTPWHCFPSQDSTFKNWRDIFSLAYYCGREAVTGMKNLENKSRKDEVTRNAFKKLEGLHLPSLLRKVCAHMNLKDSTLRTTQNCIDAQITDQWVTFHLDHLDNK